MAPRSRAKPNPVGLPLDGLDVFPALLANTPSPRTEFLINIVRERESHTQPLACCLHLLFSLAQLAATPAKWLAARL